MATQTKTLNKLTASTWGATFIKARHVYSTVVRLAIAYRLAVWHALKRIKNAKKDTINKMEIIQNRCLRVVSGAYKATPVAVLQAETMVATMENSFDQWQVKARARMKNSGQAKFILKQCRQVAANCENGPGRPRTPRPTKISLGEITATHH